MVRIAPALSRKEPLKDVRALIVDCTRQRSGLSGGLFVTLNVLVRKAINPAHFLLANVRPTARKDLPPDQPLWQA